MTKKTENNLETQKLPLEGKYLNSSIFSEILGGGDYDEDRGYAGYYPNLPENFKIYSYSEKTGKIKRVRS